MRRSDQVRRRRVQPVLQLDDDVAAARLAVRDRERRPYVGLVLQVVDAEGPEQRAELLEWLRHHEVPHTVIATKHDKVRAEYRRVKSFDPTIAEHIREDFGVPKDPD